MIFLEKNLKMSNFTKRYTEKQKKHVLELFYRTELLENEKIIDNTDGFISKKTGVKKCTVNSIITDSLNIKFDKINNRVNGNRIIN